MAEIHSTAAQISPADALAVARLVADANAFEWSEANVRIALDTALSTRACWRVTLWPADTAITEFWDQPNDVVTLLPPDILIDLQSGALVGLKPLREGVVLVEHFGNRYRAA
jgi:hypothetical protein